MRETKNEAMNDQDEHDSGGPGMRLQRWLAMCGVASRRACEQLMLEGRVTVAGRVVTQLGSRVDPDRDEVHVDGQFVKPVGRRYYVALNKPQGVVCTGNDPAGRPRAIDLVAAIPARLFPIGRLDEDSEGLLLLTNDGDFAQRVAHPRYEVPKIYRVVVKGAADPAALEKLRTGIHLAEGKTAPAKVLVLRQTRQFTTLSLMLFEGKNRELRRMFARIELPVTQLLRVAIGPVKLGSLKRGQWRMLAPAEVHALTAGPGAAVHQERGRGGHARRGSHGSQGSHGKRPRWNRAARPNLSAPRTGPRSGPRSGSRSGPRAGRGSRTRSRARG